MGIKKHTKAFVILSIASLTFLIPAAGYAQDVANGLAIANVLDGLTVTPIKPLEFGDVLQGIAKSVARDVAEAGVFRIDGAMGYGISLYIQLPDYLALADGSDRMTSAFADNDANVDLDAGSAGDPTNIAASANSLIGENPRLINGTGSITLDPASTTAYIYLGGRVTPSVDQKAGAYSGDIIMTVAYNGS